MTDEQKQKWIDAGLGVKADAEVGAAMGGLTRQRVQQVRKMIGAQAWARAQSEIGHRYLRDEIEKHNGSGFMRFCAEIGASTCTVYAVEREFGVAVKRAKQGRPRRISRQQLLDAINATKTLSEASSLLAAHQTYIHYLIREHSLRGLVNIIQLARGGKVFRGMQLQ